MRYSAKCMAIPEEMTLSAAVPRRSKMRSMLRNMTQPGRRAWPDAYVLPLLRQHAQIVAVRSSSDRSIDRNCRFEPAGIGGHDLLHHGDEALLIGLAEIGYRLEVSFERRHFHLPQQLGA